MYEIWFYKLGKYINETLKFLQQALGINTESWLSFEWFKRFKVGHPFKIMNLVKTPTKINKIRVYVCEVIPKSQ